MPTDRQQRCKKCSNRFTRPQGTNRLYCYECRPERTKVVRFPGEQFAKSGEPEEEGKLTRLSRLRLEELGVTETWQAAAVLALAVLIDTGKHGASGAAGTIKAHREAMAIAEALSDVEKKADVISWIFEKQA